MLFNLCNAVPAASSSLAAGNALCRRRRFCLGGDRNLAAGAKTAPAKTLRGAVPVVDRLAVRMVTDNIVIQFVPTEKRDGLTIERRSGNTVPDKPPRTILNGEWGLCDVCAIASAAMRPATC